MHGMSRKKLKIFFGNNMLSRNVGKLLPPYAARHPRRAKASVSPPQRPEISHGLSVL